MTYIICQSKRYGNYDPFGNKLTYNTKTSEYTFSHKGKKIWSVKDSSDLFDYTQKFYNGEIPFLDREEMYSFPAYRKYEESCDMF